MNDVTVVIPTHPGRNEDLLNRAVRSVWQQTQRPAALHINVDLDRRGAGYTRNRGLFSSDTEYTAFLDSDDEMLPDHLATLRKVFDTRADVIMAFSWFEPVGMPDPLGHFGLPFDIYHPHHTTVTTMVNTYIAQAVGGFPESGEGSTAGCLNDDWIFLLRMCEYARDNKHQIVHVPQKTWRYHGHSGNTSGRPGHGDS